MVKHIQTIRLQIADKLLESVWPFCGVGAWRVKTLQNILHLAIAPINLVSFPLVDNTVYSKENNKNGVAWNVSTMEDCRNTSRSLFKPRKEKLYKTFNWIIANV